MKLEIFGDSILKGIMYESGKYRLYKSELQEELTRENIDVHKTCKMGRTIVEAKSIIEDSDICNETVMLEFGGNDSAYNWKEISEQDGEHSPVTTKKTFYDTYCNIIEELQNKGNKIIIASLTPIDPNKYFNFISKNLNPERILSWLGDITMLSRWHESYNNIVLEIAKEYALPVVDIRKPFLESHEFSSLICDDGMHPTEKGHRLIENEIINALRA